MSLKSKLENKDINGLISLACRIGNIKKSDLLSSCRTGKVSEIRICLGKILRECYDLTQMEVGEILKRDHATIHFYEKEHQNMLGLSYYNSIYSELLLFARDSGYDVDEKRPGNTSRFLALKHEIAALKFENKEMKSKLKKYDKLKELISL
tara:strand:+ start:620 stop:1072 length:453 start_codon:yes stop_codon:yes gene_type:complete